MKLSLWKISVFILLALMGLIIMPFIQHIPSVNFNLLWDEHNLFSTTLLRTLIFAVTAALLTVIFGFLGALLLIRLPFFSWLGKNMAVLILPVTLGNISIAFICKLLIGGTTFFAAIVNGPVFYQLAFLILLQIWQFGLLFIYIFWLNFQSVPRVRTDYAIANRFSFYQSVKDIYYPFSKNLFILLGAIAFVFSLYEEAKISYLFKVSKGTNSELITNWLSRSYQSSLLVNLDFAKSLTFNSGIIVALAAILVMFFLFVLINSGSRLFSGSKIYFGSIEAKFINLSKFSIKISWSWALILLAVAALPVLFSLAKIKFNANSSIVELGFPLGMTFLATAVASAVAIFFGVASRLGWKYLLNTFSNRSVIFFIAIFLLMLIPPLVILLCGFSWMGLIGYQSNLIIYAVWITGHTILTLPILGSFVMVNHFRVTTNEINYLEVYRLNKSEFVYLSFLSRFKAEYFLLFIIGFSLIWNEAVLNSLFSDYIPSFASMLNMLITGRGADYSLAFGYLLVSMFLATLAVLVWRYIIEKAQKLND